MKKIILLTLLFTFVLIAALQDLKAQMPVAYYPFNGNANDESGNGNHGTVNGATITTDRFGIANKAYSFNGTGQHINIGNNGILRPTEKVSFSVWFLLQNPAGSINGRVPFSCTESGGWGIWYDKASNNFQFYLRRNGSYALIQTSAATYINQWTQAVVTYDGRYTRAYLNGVLIGTDDAGGTFPVEYNNNVNTLIGAEPSGGFTVDPNYHFEGKIDEVKIYNVELTTEQITNQYSADLLVAYFPFNGNASDMSGNGNNGTVVNATLTADRFGNANCAYSFDGSGGMYISVPNHPSLQLTTSYTLAAWVKPNAFYPTDCQINMIIEKDGLTAEGSYSLYYAETDGNCTAQAPNTEVFGTHISRAGVQHYLTESPVTRPVELNKWYYVVSTYDGTTQRLYVNGQLRASQNTNTNPFGTLSTAPLYIGRSHQLNTWAVNGVIDDVKIYNVPLTAGQVFNEYVNDLKRPGSGNAVLFDPNLIQAINVGTGFDQTGSFSFETWVKRTNTNVTDLNAQTFMASQLNNGWSIGINQSSPQNRIYLSKVGVSQVVSASSITDTKWHHVAVTYNATTNQVIFYIDGVADAPVSYNPGGFNSGNSTYRIGGRNNGPSFDNSLNGSLDEVRVWNNVVLSQSVIRDWMCRKITSVHPHYSSLYGYFQLNEGSGTTTGGYNGFFGTFENGPIWQTSGAALGDDAVHDFVNVTKTASISHTTGENFTVTSTSGSPAGIVVYRVDEKPNSISGANSSTNNKYFGVFQSGGSSPQYTAVYNYTGNPLVTVANEPLLRLAKRADNSVTTWTQTTALPNEPANTITLTGESTEYILGQLGSPLPVTLLSFAASRCGNNVCLLWTVENEVNFSHYEVEKSTSLSNFTVIANTTARNSSARSNYTSTDLNPAGGDNFYRLKMVNLDGSFTYSKIIRINFAKTATVSLQPNPASEFVILKGLEGYQQYRIVDATGKIHLQQNIQAPVEEIDISRLSKGLYYIQLTNKNQVTSLKLVKQ